MNFADPADHRIKTKESEKKDKYLDLAREFNKTMEHEGDNYTNRIGTVTKGLLKGLEDLEIRGRVKIIQTTTLLKTDRIQKKVLDSWGNLLSLKL